MEPAKTILFVYGTLKRGGRNYHRIGDQTFIGEVVTAPRYRVIDLGPHPGLVRDEATGLAIHGELFAVNDCCLAELDEFEEVPGPFVRELIECALDLAHALWAFAGVWLQTLVDQLSQAFGDKWIESADRF